MPPLNSQTGEDEIFRLLDLNARLLWGEARADELADGLRGASRHIRLLFSMPLSPTDEMPDFISGKDKAE